MSAESLPKNNCPIGGKKRRRTKGKSKKAKLIERFCLFTFTFCLMYLNNLGCVLICRIVNIADI